MKTVEVLVSGYSMWPNLQDGQKLDCIEYDGQDLSVGDLVVFRHPFNKNLTCDGYLNCPHASEFLENTSFI